MRRNSFLGDIAIEINEPYEVAREQQRHEDRSRRHAAPQQRERHGERDHGGRTLEGQHVFQLLDAAFAAFDIRCVQVRAFLQMLSHALFEEKLIHAALELGNIRAFRVFARDHLQSVEIAINKDTHCHANEAHTDKMRVVADKAINQILRKPGDAIQRALRDDRSHLAYLLLI